MLLTENPNLHQQQMPFHHHQFNNIMSEISADQKPTLATNHLTEPVINYEAGMSKNKRRNKIRTIKLI